MKDTFFKKNIPLSPADLVHQEASWKYMDEIEKTNKQTSKFHYPATIKENEAKL